MGEESESRMINNFYKKVQFLHFFIDNKTRQMGKEKEYDGLATEALAPEPALEP